MSADAVQAIKVKVDEYLAKVPVVNEQVEKIAHKLKVEKAYVAVSIVAVVFLLIVLIGGGDIVL
jgi:hypothetical protein